ncbi:MAG: DivIVA domain-containing protein [Actinomycetota bacterium]|nr:DivIVA domain-containing protein [Actinomycetota bacterium]
MRESITPEDIKGANFSVAIRGYDRGEVEAFLRDVAAGVSALLDSSEKPYQSLGEEVGELLQQAKDAADKLFSEARDEAAALVQSAQDDATALRDEAEAHAQQVREYADGEVARKIAQADEEAANRIGAADARAQELSTTEVEARQRISALRTELEAVGETLRRLGTQGTSDAGVEHPAGDVTDEQDRVDTTPRAAELQEPAR